MELDLHDIKPSLMSAVVILGVVIVGVPLLKWAMAKWPVKGLADLINAV
jgi:hypothetical protein